MLAYRKHILRFSQQCRNQFEICFLQKMWNSRHKLFISEHFKLSCSISSQNSKNWFFNLNKTNRFTRENGVNIKITFTDISMKGPKVITKFIKIIREWRLINVISRHNSLTLGSKFYVKRKQFLFFTRYNNFEICHYCVGFVENSLFTVFDS